MNTRSKTTKCNYSKSSPEEDKLHRRIDETFTPDELAQLICCELGFNNLNVTREEMAEALSIYYFSQE